jgi:glycosyltransferase involved in cell wall biosynthesis
MGSRQRELLNSSPDETRSPALQAETLPQTSSTTNGKSALHPVDTEKSTDVRLLVCMPALNEERTVGQVIQGIPSHIPGIRSIDVLVVDDGSTDQTAQRATEAGAIVVRHPTSRGVGAAFHSALSYGIEHGADLIVSIDADGQFNPADIPALVAPVVTNEADFTTASRFKDPALIPQMSGIKLWGNRMMSRLVSRLTGETFSDVSCGMRCYSRRAALQLYVQSQFTYTQEVFLNLTFKHLRIVEVPIRVRGEREFGKSRVASNLWQYGFRTANIIFRVYRDYFPLRFFGGIAFGLMLIAQGLGLFLFIHYLQTKSLSPHKWAGFGAGAFLALSLAMVHLGLIGDMLNRQRIYLEELLYRQRIQSANGREIKNMEELSRADEESPYNEKNRLRGG